MDRGFRVFSSTDGSSDRMSIDYQPPIVLCTKHRGEGYNTKSDALGAARPSVGRNFLGSQLAITQ